MWSRGVRRRRTAAVLLAVGLTAASCSGDDDAEPGADPAPATENDQSSSGREPGADAVSILADEGSGAATAALLDLLPADVGGVVVADLVELRTAVGAGDVDDLLAGEGSAPIVAEMLGAIGDSGSLVDLSVATMAVLAYGAEGDPVLLAALTTNSADEVLRGAPTGSAADGSPRFDAGKGRVAAVLADGTLAVGNADAVDGVLAAAAEGPAPAGPLGAYVESVIDGGTLEFVLGLPGLIDGSSPTDTLRGSAALSGTFQIDNSSIRPSKNSPPGRAPMRCVGSGATSTPAAARGFPSGAPFQY